MRANNDIETALYNKLTEDNYSASAHALPADLGGVFPHIHVERTGGTTSDFIIESHSVDFDVYGADQADATEAAADLCAWVRNLGGQMVCTICYSADVSTLPYNNPDPRHPNIARATFKAQILTRTRGD